MKRNAAKSLESRMKVDAISALENTVKEDTSMRESMMIDGKKQVAVSKTSEHNSLSKQKNILSDSAVQSRDELYFYEVDTDRSRKKMDMQMSTSEFKGMYGYKPTFSKVKSPKSDVRAMADNVLYDALPGSTTMDKSAPAAVGSGSAETQWDLEDLRKDSGVHVELTENSKVDAEDEVSPQQLSTREHLNVNADASVVSDNDADNMIYSSPLSSSYISRKTPTPPRTRPLSPPSNIKLANVMSDTLHEDLQYEIETLKMNVRNDPTAADGCSSHEKRDMKNNNLVENQENTDNVVIEDQSSESCVDEEDVDPLNASSVSNDDPMNSSNVSFGTAALENAMASIIATNDAAYGISPLGNTRKGLPKDQSLEIDEENLMDSLQQGKAVPLHRIEPANDVRESEISTHTVVDELRDIDESLSSPFRPKENNGKIMPVNNATLETLESEIWKEHLELKKLGLL